MGCGAHGDQNPWQRRLNLAHFLCCCIGKISAQAFNRITLATGCSLRSRRKDLAIDRSILRDKCAWSPLTNLTGHQIIQKTLSSLPAMDLSRWYSLIAYHHCLCETSLHSRWHQVSFRWHYPHLQCLMISLWPRKMTNGMQYHHIPAQSRNEHALC